MTDIRQPKAAALDELLAAGYRVEYAADTVWDGWLYADLLDSRGRRVQCGSGANEAEALADLVRRLDRDEVIISRRDGEDSGIGTTPANARAAALGDGELIADERAETVAELHADRSYLIRALADACNALRRIEIATTGDGGLAALLKAGHAVSFTYEPADGYRAVIDVFAGDEAVTVHEGIAATPLEALAAAAQGMGASQD
jgi:hypothetical protein